MFGPLSVFVVTGVVLWIFVVSSVMLPMLVSGKDRFEKKLNYLGVKHLSNQCIDELWDIICSRAKKQQEEKGGVLRSHIDHQAEATARYIEHLIRNPDDNVSHWVRKVLQEHGAL